MNTKWIFPLLMLSLLIISAANGKTLCSKRDPLFEIERNKNKNVVKYDACLLPNNDVSESKPIDAYWVMANGKKENLNAIESKQAYGIKSEEKLGKNRFRIGVAGLKDKTIIVEKMKGDYKAVTQINGQPSILDRVYITSEEHRFGLPSVKSIDFFGHSLKTNQPVEERITPK